MAAAHRGQNVGRPSDTIASAARA